MKCLNMVVWNVQYMYVHPILAMITFNLIYTKAIRAQPEPNVRFKFEKVTLLSQCLTMLSFIVQYKGKYQILNQVIKSFYESNFEFH